MTDTINKVPEIAGEEMSKGNEQRVLLPDEMMALQQLRGQVHQICLQIGQLEVQKALKIAAHGHLEAQAQVVMQSAAERLGIAPGTHWQADPDGVITILSVAPPTQESQEG